MSETAKGSYVNGVNDVLSFLSAATADDPKCGAKVVQLPSGFRIIEMVKSIDLLYQDPANARIPIYIAIRFSARRMTGDDPQDLERDLAIQRLLWRDRSAQQ
jgi:hypothetical protein